MCAQLITRVVNYRVMRCRVRARGLLHISPPSPFFLLLFGYFARHCPIPAGHPSVERERTNKSARALRRDIVSCKVNHLRGSKTAASPRRDLLSSPHEASRRRLLPRTRRFCTILSAQASPLLLLSSSRPLRPLCVPVFSTNKSSPWSVQLASISGHIVSSLTSSDS